MQRYLQLWYFSLTISGPLFVALVKDSKYFHADKKIRRETKSGRTRGSCRAKKRKRWISWRKKNLLDLSSLSRCEINTMICWSLSCVVKKSRWISILTPVSILIFTFVFFSPRIGFILFPPTDNSVINISVEAKNGTDKIALEKIPSNYMRNTLKLSRA